MARGRKPTPTHLKVVTGNPGRRPLNDAEPNAVRSRPSCPAHASDKAKETWGYVCGMLDRMGILSEVDAIAIEMLCEAYADWLGAKRALAEFGSDYYQTENSAGGVMHRAHPAVATKADADRRIRGWLAEFGMTPSSRSRVKVDGEKAEDDPLSQYIG